LASPAPLAGKEGIANAIAFLASPEAGWITAQTLTVAGGRMDYIGHG
jgi:NAD(P)-dependent dehydrogenase (short-subunit alcohol dehydrogenase family)